MKGKRNERDGGKNEKVAGKEKESRVYKQVQTGTKTERKKMKNCALRLALYSIYLSN